MGALNPCCVPVDPDRRGAIPQRSPRADCKGHSPGSAGIRPPSMSPVWREVRAKSPLVCAPSSPRHAFNLQSQRRHPPTFKRLVHSFRRSFNPLGIESCRCILTSPSFPKHRLPSTPRSPPAIRLLDENRRYPRSPSRWARIRIGSRSEVDSLCQATPFLSPRQPTSSRREVIASRTSPGEEALATVSERCPLPHDTLYDDDRRARLHRG